MKTKNSICLKCKYLNGNMCEFWNEKADFSITMCSDFRSIKLSETKTNFEQIKEEGLREFEEMIKKELPAFYSLLETKNIFGFRLSVKIIDVFKQFLQTYANKIKRAVEEDLKNNN